MTEQERQQACLDAIKEMETQFGYALQAGTTARQFGQMIQVEPTLTLIPIPGWTPPVEKKDV